MLVMRIRYIGKQNLKAKEEENVAQGHAGGEASGKFSVTQTRKRRQTPPLLLTAFYCLSQLIYTVQLCRTGGYRLKHR